MSEHETIEQKKSNAWLPLMVLWGLSPALALTLSGLMMEWHAGDAASSSFLILGILGGPVALLLWSARLLWWTPWTTTTKILLVLPLTALACTVNLLLAAGACAVIAPPMNFH